jgi:hypothetical protein
MMSSRRREPMGRPVHQEYLTSLLRRAAAIGYANTHVEKMRSI